MKWTCAPYTLEMRDEPMHSFGSSDNARNYDHELLLSGRYTATSKHGVILFDGDIPVASLVIGTGAGATGVHEQSAILADGVCFAVVGPELVCLAVPTCAVRWHHEADSATCFGVHLSPTEQAVVVHGELEVSKWTFDGQLVWRFGGADIFTGALSITGQTVIVSDFEGRVYRIDLSTGYGVQESA